MLIKNNYSSSFNCIHHYLIIHICICSKNTPHSVWVFCIMSWFGHDISLRPVWLSSCQMVQYSSRSVLPTLGRGIWIIYVFVIIDVSIYSSRRWELRLWCDVLRKESSFKIILVKTGSNFEKNSIVLLTVEPNQFSIFTGAVASTEDRAELSKCGC